MTPTLASSQIQQAGGDSVKTLITSAITVTNGDVIVAKIAMEDQASATINIPTSAGATFAAAASDTTTSNAAVAIYTAVIAGNPGTITVTEAYTGGTGVRRAMVVERWTGAQLAVTPATNGTKLATGTNGFSGSVTTVAANSAVTWVAGDWSAIAPGVPAYRSSATQDGLADYSTIYFVGYFATQAAASPTAQTFGTTTPAASTKMKYLAIEVQDASAPAYPFLITQPTPRYRAAR